MTELKTEIKTKIIESLNLEGMTPADIDDDTPLFGDGLGADSIDALELIVMLDRSYGIKLTNPAESRDILKSVNTIAAYVQANRK